MVTRQVSRFGGGATRLGAPAGSVVEARRGVWVVFFAALAVWWLEALIIPLAEGRDLGTYLGAYVQLFQSHPIDLGYVLGRTPVAPLVVGGLLDLAHGAFAEPAMSLLYAGSIVCWFLAARTFSRTAALLTAVVLIVYPGYGILFHEVSSDSVFAAGFAAWSLLAVRTMCAPSWQRFALTGGGVAVLTLIRPANQIMLVLALLPLALRAAWRTRVVWAVAFAVPALAILGGWVLTNGLRYDDYILVRGGNATVPFFRAFVTDKIVRPSNGDASRELARAVQRDLLPKEPYRSYHITLDDFFREASPRMEVDLVALSDRLKGWYTNDRWLRDVGMEAVRAHPATYARGVAGSTWGLLTESVYRSPAATSTDTSATGSSGGAAATVVIAGKRLPKPSEGEPIPAPHEGGITTPDRSIYTVWTSPTEHHMVFVHPGDEARNAALHRRMRELAGNLPDRAGNAGLAHRLNQASRWFIPALLWLVLGAIALALRRTRGALAASTPTVAALLVILVSAAGLPAEPHYSVPMAPAFVLLAGTALFAPRRASVAVGDAARAWRFAGIAVGIVAAVWAAEVYVSKISDRFSASSVPHDLAVFLGAAGKILDGSSPYAFHADQTYAYPPLLAFLVAPLHPLGATAATLIWTLVSLAAVGLALFFLGLRDWRCYALVPVFPFTRSAIDLGTVAPLLLLAVAVAWRWRASLAASASAVGAAIALKLFLWPLAVWHALMGRIRTAIASVGFALALTVLPWAVLGFDGLGDYPRLLHRLADDEATSSYSVIALAVRAHLSQAVGVALSLVAAALLLAAAARVARDVGRTQRERDVTVLTLALAAALAASPIVWVHYFLLLLVPLALTRPRLSPLWFVPFAYYPLGESAWPAGDAGKLGLALATTCVLLGAAVVRNAPGRTWLAKVADLRARNRPTPELRTGPP